MAHRLDFTIRNPIPSKGSYLILQSVMHADFGADRAILGGPDHQGSITWVTDALHRGKEYEMYLRIQHAHPKIPLRLRMTDSGSVLHEQLELVKDDEVTFTFNVPPFTRGALQLSLSYDTESKEVKELPHSPIGDFAFISSTFEEM